jgi:hypothetical protein
MPRLFNSRILMGKYQITSKVNKANLSYDVDEKDATTCAQLGFSVVFPGMSKVGADIGGLMDVGVPNPDSGAGALQINVVAVAGTFTRTTGSFLVDGFAIGQTIVTSGFVDPGNNTTKVISTVTATVITVTNVAGLVNETGNNNERVIGDLMAYMESIIAANLGSETNMPITLAPAASRAVGYAEGDPACFWRALIMGGAPIEGSIGDLHSFSLKVPRAAARLVSGRQMLPLTALSGATGNGSSIQLGAVSATQKVYAALHVFGVTGAPSGIVVKVRSDADNAWPAGATDRLTSASFTAPTSEWLELAGPITDTYWRVEYTITGGTAPTFTAAVAVGIGPA